MNDGVEASARKSRARFQIVRMSLEKSEKLSEISLSLLQPHHMFY